MLDFLRRKAQSTYLQATVIVIILVFVFWGVGTNQGPGRNGIATVNGETITFQEYDKAYERTMDQYQAQFGGNLPADFAKTIGLKRQVLDQLIQTALIRQGGREMGIYASDEEIQDAIRNMPVFLNNGEFDVERYNTVLRCSRLTPKKFETGMRADMLSGTTARQVAAFAHALDSELRDKFLYDNEERQLEYVIFKAADFVDKVTVNEEILTDFFTKNQNDYRTLPQVKLKYLSFLLADEMAAINPTESDIEDYYQQHIEQYSVPETRRARHILLRATDENLEAQQKKMAEILQKARNGEDFAALAKQFSDDGSAANGGDLGFFNKKQMVQPFAEAAFSLKEGQISDIVRTRFGLHIIKLEEIKPGKTTPLTEVRESILKKIKEEQAKTAVFKKANETYEKIILSGSLAKYAADNKVTIAETDFFSKDSMPTELAGNPGMIKTIFSLKKGELSSLLEGPNGYDIIYVEDFKGPETPPFAEVKERVEKDYIAAESRKLAKEAAEKLLTEVKEGDFAKLCQEQGLTVEESDFFSRSKKFSKGLPAGVINEAFNLSDKKPFPEKISESNDNFYVFHLKEIKKTTEEEFAAKRETLLATIKRENQLNLMSAWLEYLRGRAEITINKQFLQD